MKLNSPPSLPQRLPQRFFCALLSLLLLSGCTSTGDSAAPPQQGGQGSPQKPAASQTGSKTEDKVSTEVVFTPKVLAPSADGAVLYETEVSSLDASNAAEGYVMVSYHGDASKVKLIIKTPAGGQYTYDLIPGGGYQAFPLTEGNGTYNIGTFENVTGTTYSTDLSQDVDVTISNEFGPYLYPNQYVNFNADSQVVKKAQELAAGAMDELAMVQNVYSFVVGNITYDTERKQAAESGALAGYLPVVDDVLAQKKGICFDYAAVVASMLRSVGIPTQLQIGYMGTLYHAWVSTYITGVGWVNGVIQFDGKNWTMMDPTTAAEQGDEKTAEYIKNGSYQVQYKY